MALTVADIRSDLKLMEASGTNVFFRYSLTNGKADKTDIMTPHAAAVFLNVAEEMGIEFQRIWMGRSEQF